MVGTYLLSRILKGLKIFSCQKILSEKSVFSKGQLISKTICQAEDSPKNERMNSFSLLCDVFLFVFWENPRLDWFAFEINWPLWLSCRRQDFERKFHFQHKTQKEKKKRLFCASKSLLNFSFLFCNYYFWKCV